MYEKHFGFQRPPFKPSPTGEDVFLGPSTAGTIKAVRKALARQDAVVAVSGPVGVGKTTSVGRALDAVGGKQTRIRIGRMSIGHDEILDYLLEVLGVTNAPSSTIRRIAAFRAVLLAKKQADERVIVIVEDGARLGVDPLAELEALTAADGGAGGGAALIVMGDPSLRSALDNAALDRLNQRTLLRHSLAPLSDGELTGYLKHCFRRSAVDFDRLFDKATAELLCQLAGGIPRVCNNLVESSLTGASEQGAANVDADLLARVADQEYGLTPRSTSADVSQIAEALVPPPDFPLGDGKPEIEVSQTSQVRALSAEDLEEHAAAGADSAPTVADTTFDTAAGAEEVTATAVDGELTLAEATVPELPVLDNEYTRTAARKAAELADAQAANEAPPAESAPEPAPEPEPEPEPELEPFTLSLESDDETPPATAEATVVETPQAEPPAQEGPAAADIPSTALPEPDWDSEPTLAELRPDLDAIESAMAEDAELPPAVEQAAAEVPDVDVELRDPTLTGVPELKLDESIQASIDEARSALQEHDSTIADADGAAGAAEPPSEEIQKIAKGLARAKTLDDVDDQMAETLFGEEFSRIAAEVAASCANLDIDEMEEPTGATDQAPPATPAASPKPTAAAATPQTEKPAPKAAPAAASASPATGAAAAKASDTSPSARLATVRALNQPGAAATAAKPAAGMAAPVDGQPASIESQFAETIAPAARARSAEIESANDDDDDDDDDDDKKKGGFFSRFKRS